MSSTPNYPVHVDAALVTTKALPAQNTNNSHDGINLGQTTQFPTSKKLALRAAIPATPSLANGQTITFTAQDSADGVTYASIPELAAFVITGAGGVGAAAAERIWPLPGTTRKWVRINQAASATAGDNTAVTVTTTLLLNL